MCYASDNNRQCEMIKVYAEHLSHLYEREVSHDEAAYLWVKHSMAERYKHETPS